MAERKQRIYVVNDQRNKVKRLVQATSPQAAITFACKDVSAQLATQNDLYLMGMVGRQAVENAPVEPEPAQAAIPTGGSYVDPKTLLQNDGNDDLRYATRP